MVQIEMSNFPKSHDHSVQCNGNWQLIMMTKMKASRTGDDDYLTHVLFICG